MSSSTSGVALPGGAASSIANDSNSNTFGYAFGGRAGFAGDSGELISAVATANCKRATLIYEDPERRQAQDVRI